MFRRGPDTIWEAGGLKDTWNPWHGCRKISEGCAHCYMYRRALSVGRDPKQIEKTADFALPMKKGKNGWKIPDGSSIFACMTSDFFLEQADSWRAEAWEMIRARKNIHFFIITKRVLRIGVCLPPDWGEGWGNVSIGATAENQKRLDQRLENFRRCP